MTPDEVAGALRTAVEGALREMRTAQLSPVAIASLSVALDLIDWSIIGEELARTWKSDSASEGR